MDTGRSDAQSDLTNIDLAVTPRNNKNISPITDGFKFGAGLVGKKNKLMPKSLADKRRMTRV